MPKVELHLHLEGAIPLDAMWRLVVARGGDPEVPSPGALADRFIYSDFDHFIETWVWMNRFLDSIEAFELAAEAVARELVHDHVMRAEASFSPTDFARHGLAPEQLATAIRRGLDRVPGVEVALIVDLVRDTGPQRAMRTFERVVDVADEAGIIGIGIGGTEARFPPDLFADVYARAERAGLRRTAHAGEAAGPESVWGAIESLGVDRIGHGVRAVEDPRLVDHLVATRMPLEVCPTSNIRTGVVEGWDTHPAAELIAAGAAVTINSDDPAMFHCTLTGEYESVAARFGLSDEAVLVLARNAIDAAWVGDERRAEMHHALIGWWETQTN